VRGFSPALTIAVKRGDLQRCPRIDDLRVSLTSVSPLEGGVEERLDDARREREDLWRDVRGEFPQELVRGLPLAPGIRALVVEVELVRERVVIIWDRAHGVFHHLLSRLRSLEQRYLNRIGGWIP
jgi:hypothetical protein